MRSIHFIIFCGIMTHPNQKTIIELTNSAFTNNRFLLKSMYGAILDKAFNFSPAFLKMSSM